jgi:hypothetical protein
MMDLAPQNGKNAKYWIFGYAEGDRINRELDQKLVLVPTFPLVLGDEAAEEVGAEALVAGAPD